MRLLARTLAAAAVFVMSALVARADSLTYDFVTNNTPDGVISTKLPGSPTPSSFTPTSFEVTAPVIVDGDEDDLEIDFYTLAAGGGASGGGMRFDGPQLFTGPTSMPTFLTGVFPFEEFEVTITPVASASEAVPEPSTLLLFGIGAFVCYGLARIFRSVH